MTATSYSLTPDSASIQPEPQDFEAVEREFGLSHSTQANKRQFIGIARASHKDSKDIRFGPTTRDAVSIVPRVRALRAFALPKPARAYVDNL